MGCQGTQMYYIIISFLHVATMLILVLIACNYCHQMAAVVTIGFVKDAKHHIDVQGFNVYHKNRLIKVCFAWIYNFNFFLNFGCNSMWQFYVIMWNELHDLVNITLTVYIIFDWHFLVLEVAKNVQLHYVHRILCSLSKSNDVCIYFVNKPELSTSCFVLHVCMFELLTMYAKQSKSILNVLRWSSTLFQPFWRLWNPAGSDGRGVIGIDLYSKSLISVTRLDERRALEAFHLCWQVCWRLILLNQLMISKDLNVQLFLPDLRLG